MKKRLLYALILVLLSIYGNAQVFPPSSKTIYPLPYVQGFNATIIPADWTTQLVTATAEKVTFVASAVNQTATPQEGTDFVMFSSYTNVGGGAGAEERLISPGIVTTGTPSVNLQFYWFESGSTTYTNPAEGVQVEWSTDGLVWANSTFYPRYVSTAPTTGAWVKKIITLPAGAGGIPTLFISYKFHSEWGYNCYIDNLLVQATPTCNEPTLLTISNITTTSATIGWTASVPAPANGYDIYYSTSPTAPTAGTTPSASVAAGITTYNMTGLTASSTYYVWVRAVCSPSDKSNWAGSVTFNTLCGVISTFPWTENFDAMAVVGSNVFPTCWMATSPSGTPWYSGNAGGNTYNDPCSAPNYVYVYYSPYPVDKFLFTPGFALTAGTSYDFKFSWVGDAHSGWTGDILVNSTQTGTGATALGASFVTAGTTTPATCSLASRSFTPASTGTYYFMIRVNNTVAPYYLGFDDFKVEPTPTCVEPTALTMSAIAISTATISWTAPASAPANGYDIYYSTSSTPPLSGTTPSGSVAAGVTTFNLTGLTQNTLYYVWVRSVCSPSDKSSWAGPTNFYTLCGPVTSLPWTENFDAMPVVGNSIIPNCWKFETPSGTPWSSGNAASQTYNDPCSAPNYVYSSYNPYGAGIYKFLITPGFTLVAGIPYDFKFNWVGDGTAGWTGDVMTNTTQTGVGATEIGLPFVDAGTTTTATCTLVTRTFTPPASGTFYFMVRLNTATITPWYLGLDDFMLTGPPCDPPTALTATNITSSAADLGWTSSGTSWEFQYGLSGYTPTATGTGTATNPVHVAGLNAGTAYDFYVRNNCLYSFSNWAGPFTFTTGASAPTMVTAAATAVTATGATLHGTATANGASTTVSFEYGLTTLYGSTAAGVPPTVTGSTATAISAVLSGLLQNTTYHFRIKGVNSYGTIYGNDMTFTTLAAPPTVATNPATGVVQTAVQLHGTVTANNATTTVTFQYGPTIAYGSVAAGVPATVDGTTATAILANITGLTPNTLYHFRCVGVNTGGTTNGGDLTFTTLVPAAPAAVTDPATNTNLTIGTLNGTVTGNGAITTVNFEYGLTTGYGSSVAATPATVPGNNTPTAVNASLTGLIPLSVYHYRVVAVNSVGTTNGNDMTFLTVCPVAGPAGPITGPTSVCQGGSGYVYSVTIPSAQGYVWTLPIGATITSGANTNTITVSYAYNAVAGPLFVYGTAECGNGASSQLAISVNPPATPTITGPTSACLNSTGNVYTTQTGMTNYVWLVSSGGLITSGGTGTSSSVTVSWTTTGAKTVSVNYNNAGGCAGLTPAVRNVTVNPLPVPTITGPSPACSNFPCTPYSTEAGMTGYVWTVSAGGTITSGAGTNSICVTWNATGVQTVSVNYVNADGCSATASTIKNVTVNAGASPTITGLTNVCVNSGYITYTTQPGMTGYSWAVSSGGIINYGSGTNSIMVTWAGSGPQWVSVSYTNANGCTPATPVQLNVMVDPLPEDAGIISGTSNVCTGATGVEYSVEPILNASSYVWSLPAGATIASGAGTNSITVDFAPDGAPGDITVYGNNVCGNGTVSPPLTVAFSHPVAPVISELPFGLLTSDYPDGNQWYQNGVLIPGATDQTYQVLVTDYYWDVVTVDGCISDTSNNLYVIVEGVNSLMSGNIVVHPNPNDGQFTVSMFSPTRETFTLGIYNNLGMKIYEASNIVVNGKLDKVIDLKPIAPGIYSVVLQNGKSQIQKKILVTK